jgi:DNA-binding IscR family transcriptional regulator
MKDNLKVFNEKIVEQAIREYISEQKNKKATLIEAAHVATQLELPYELVKEIFHKLAREGILSSLEYIPA